MAKPILAALDWAAVRLIAFALRHGADPIELRQAITSAYRHKSWEERAEAATSKLGRAEARNRARAARRDRAILP
jgi:hypothetical protein